MVESRRIVAVATFVAVSSSLLGASDVARTRGAQAFVFSTPTSPAAVTSAPAASASLDRRPLRLPRRAFAATDGETGEAPAPAVVDMPPYENAPRMEGSDEPDLYWRNEIRELELSELSAKYSKTVPMTVRMLRKEFGTRSSWWGDLTSAQTRELYHSLLPKILLLENEFEDLPLKNRAYIASAARYAARLYARERCRLPGRIAANIYDGARHAIRYGRWSWTGMTVDQIWLKYENELKAEQDGEHDFETDVFYQALYRKIIAKSCSTNPFFDRISNVSVAAVLANVTAVGK